MSNKTSKNYIGQAWLIIVLGMLYGLALAGVQLGLRDRIAENKRLKTYRQIPNIVPGAVSEKTKELMADIGGKETKVYQIFDIDNAHIGWVIPAEGMGFADKIVLLYGLNADRSTITGMAVLDQKETPGLGDKIRDEEFTLKYKNKPAEQELVVVKLPTAGEQNVEAITGATVSSRAVTTIINQSKAAIMPVIGNLPDKPVSDSPDSPDADSGDSNLEDSTHE